MRLLPTRSGSLLLFLHPIRSFFCAAQVDHCFFHSNNHESGAENILTQWLPWSDVSVQTGGLAVLRGSNRLPGFRRLRETYMDVDVSATDIEDAGAFTDDPHELLRYDPDCQWLTSDYRAGDVLVFTMHTFHGGVVNGSEDALRISSDIRWLPAHHRLDGRYTVPRTAPRENTYAGATRTLAEAVREWGLVESAPRL